jgi:uncharacterized protein YceH (UPF0502 family)
MTLKLLTPIEARVLGTLMEKARTVPDSYPLSMNALVIGCSQKTSRDPLMDVTAEDARTAIESLKGQSLVFEAPASRVSRFEHNFQRASGMTEPESVVIGLLMLRGAQTPAELRANGERWYKFVDMAAVEAVLQALQQRGDSGGQTSVQKLPRMPGAREQRWTHLLCGAPDVQALMSLAKSDGGTTDMGDSNALAHKIEALESAVTQLQADNAVLRQQVLTISEQLGITLPNLADVLA